MLAITHSHIDEEGQVSQPSPEPPWVKVGRKIFVGCIYMGVIFILGVIAAVLLWLLGLTLGRG